MVDKVTKLTCTRCPATAKDISKERGRFLRRHPLDKKCIERKKPTIKQEG